MIVTCTECSTSFQLDESRIPQQGVRVRCSRCKHAFFLPHPSASEEEAVDAVAAEAAATGRPPMPESAHDLAAANSAAQTRDGIGGDDHEEEDWQFNADVPIGGADDDSDPGFDDSRPDFGEDAETDADDQPEFGFDGSFDASEGDDGSDEIDAGIGEPAAPEEPAIDRSAASSAGPDLAEPTDDASSSFGSVDDFSGLMDTESRAKPSPASPASAATPDLGESIREGAGRYGKGGTKDDLGDPESWDFFGDQPASEARPRKEPAVTSPAPAARRAAPASRFDDDEAVDFDPTEYGDAPGVLGLAGRLVGGLGNAVGFVVTMGLLGFALYRGLAPSLWPPEPAPQIVAFGGLEAEATRAYWIDSAAEGRLFIVEGEVRTRAARAAVNDRPIEVSLLDERGQPLPGLVARAGEPIAAVDLRSLGPAEFAATRLASVAKLNTVRVAPGRPMSFAAIFSRVPADARRFLLTVGEPRIAPVQREQPVETEVVDEAAAGLAEQPGSAPNEGADAVEATGAPAEKFWWEEEGAGSGVDSESGDVGGAGAGDDEEAGESWPGA